MQIDPQLRQRILRSLRWLVVDAQYRFNDCKDQLAPEGRGGYSPELKEAIQLLQDLEQGNLLQANPIVAKQFTERDCIETGNVIGMTTKDSIEFYCQYGSQGWVKGNGLPITDLVLAMRQWKMRGQEDTPEPVRVQGKTPRQLDKERNA